VLLLRAAEQDSKAAAQKADHTTDRTATLCGTMPQDVRL
jgi:hypothetical protein